MKKLILLVAIFLVLDSVGNISGQKVIKNSSVTGICFAGKKVNRIYIPPPDFKLRKSGASKGGSIDVYYVGFSSQARAATEYAVSILEGILPSDAHITISASWERITNDGVLGSTSITGYVAGWNIDALNPMAIYPLSVAEKIAGESFNEDTEGDVRLTLNSSIEWYYGTDGNTPTNKYDLVTVILHELIHGLGFFNSFGISGTVASYGFSSVPFIFDTFVETLDGSRLTDTTKFRNNSSQLLSQITGGRLFFDGPVLSQYASGGRARLYAPSSYSAGSSVSHLDEDQTLKLDALMTPFIDLGEAIHDPGNLTEAILGDLGWVNTRISHTPIKDTEENLTEIKLSINIKSDTSFSRNNVRVVYSFDGFKTEQTRFLISPLSDNNFETTISLPSYNTDLQYYFYVEDYFRRIFRSPSLYNILRYQVYVGADTIKPLIEHTPGDYLLETVDSLSFEAVAVDNIGVDTVYLEYRVNDGTSYFRGLSRVSGNNYRTGFSSKLVDLKGGDSLRYRLVAVDTSIGRNMAYLPSKGYFSIGVEDIKTPVEGYASDFSASEGDFFNIGFSMSMPKDFTSKALHTNHPYVSPEDNDKSINYTALLRYPVKIGESGLLFRYREIVLVEPGENGSVYGTEEFYDYVVVEGSKDSGKTWFAFEDGYDSRYYSLWESLYNNSVEGNNSTFVPVESMLRDHSFYVAPSGKVSAGDTLLVRFRLFSDPFANGWGWVIEDLKINPLIDSVEDNRTVDFTVYPNPGNGKINVRTKSDGASGPMKFTVVNASGIVIKNGILSGEGDSVIDISDSPEGFYIISVADAYSFTTVKYSLVR